MMAKDYVLQALSDAHLRAIGKVCAQWSSFEDTLLTCVSDVSAIPKHTILILIGTQGVNKWWDILRALSGDHAHKHTELSKLWVTVEALQKQRNQIVHGHWHPDWTIVPDGEGGANVYYAVKKSKHKAEASGISHNKRAPATKISVTAAEILKVAKGAQAAEKELAKWLWKWRKAHPKESAPTLGG